MDPLLTIDTFEGDDSTRSWLPYENPAKQSPTGFDPLQPTSVQIGSGYQQQLYICRRAPEHPHTELMQ